MWAEQADNPAHCVLPLVAIAERLLRTKPLSCLAIFCGWRRRSKLMCKGGSWIQPGIESHRASFSAFSTGALCSLPTQTLRFLLSSHRDVLQLVKWPQCQEIGDLTGLSGRLFWARLCLLISSAALASWTPRVSQLQGWNSFPYSHSKSQALSPGQQSLAGKRGKLNSQRENLLYQGLLSWGCNF